MYNNSGEFEKFITEAMKEAVRELPITDALPEIYRRIGGTMEKWTVTIKPNDPADVLQEVELELLAKDEHDAEDYAEAWIKTALPNHHLDSVY